MPYPVPESSHATKQTAHSIPHQRRTPARCPADRGRHGYPHADTLSVYGRRHLLPQRLYAFTDLRPGTPEFSLWTLSAELRKPQFWGSDADRGPNDSRTVGKLRVLFLLRGKNAFRRDRCHAWLAGTCRARYYRK